jgi:hypothetical protein
MDEALCGSASSKGMVLTTEGRRWVKRSLLMVERLGSLPAVLVLAAGE